MTTPTRFDVRVFALLALVAMTACQRSHEETVLVAPPGKQTQTTASPEVHPALDGMGGSSPTPSAAAASLADPQTCAGLVTTAPKALGDQPRRLSDAGYLRKLSLHLRGVRPETAEYDDLAKATDKEAFFNAKIDEYMKSSTYAKKMVFRLGERFRFSPVSQFNPISSGVFGDDPDAATDLFSRLASDNLSWDELFTGTHYLAFPRGKTNFLGISDFGFWRAVFPKLPDDGLGDIDPRKTIDPSELADDQTAQDQNPSTQPTPPAAPQGIAIDFPPGDLRSAGVLTTARFIGRYMTTALNKNRRRAAAVYNVAFCDPMIPSVITGNDPKHDFLDKSYADKFEVSDKDLNDPQKGVNLSAEALHGSNPDCRACHMKLDPLGKTFQNIGSTLLPAPSAGSLVLRRSATDVFVQKVAGIGELGRAIVKQPEYVDCQTRYLWTEFIGRDIPVTKSRALALQCEFEKVGHKTNDFVKKLVTAEDFRTEPADRGQLLFSDVRDLLKRCDSCHAKEDDVPVFANLPMIGIGGKDITTETIAKIVARMNLPDTSSKKMPKDWRTNWSETDLSLLKRWLENGAKDEDGKPLK